VLDPEPGRRAPGRDRHALVRGRWLGAGSVPRQADARARGHRDRDPRHGLPRDPRPLPRTRLRRGKQRPSLGRAFTARAGRHQTWLRDRATGNYLLDVFREPHDGETWIFRYDDAIRLPYSEIIHHTPGGIPYLAPELVLLFKAKHARPKDQADFDETIPHLTPAQRQTLAGFLARAHPGHHWLANL
jgi:hypothetical protein